MQWKKVHDAAQEWAGGVNPKTLYRAIRGGKLKAARIGAGRNFLLCEAWVDEWLLRASTRRKPGERDAVATLRPRDVA